MVELKKGPSHTSFKYCRLALCILNVNLYIEKTMNGNIIIGYGRTVNKQNKSECEFISYYFSTGFRGR